MTRASQPPVGPGLPVVEGVTDLDPIGRGGFARVYRGWQAEMRRHVAVKVLDGVVDDPDSARRFRREVAAMGAASHHPNVVPVYVTGVTTDGHPYLVMPYFPGGTLNERLREAPLDPDVVAAVGTKVAGALAAAHDTGVLHRDVKPSNILFSAYDEPLLADFGIARLSDSTLTNSNVVAATIAYAAPESLSGQPVGPVADVYSLGATLYAALAGAPPFVIGPDETLTAFVARAVTQPPADLRLAGVPGPLTATIERAMAKDPADRTLTAARLQSDLAACTNNRAAAPVVPAETVAQSVVAPARLSEDSASAGVAGLGDAWSGRSGAPMSRRRGVIAAAATLVVALLVLAFVVYRNQSDSGSQAATPTSRRGPSSTAPSSSSSAPPATAAPTTGRPAVPITPSTSTTTSAPATTGPTTTARVGAAPGAATPTETISKYYALLSSGGVDEGFRWLTPAYQQQAGGLTAYRSFWRGIRSVDASAATPQGPDRATATLRYVKTDGSVSVDNVELRFARDQSTGNLLIDGYRVLESRRAGTGLRISVA